MISMRSSLSLILFLSVILSLQFDFSRSDAEQETQHDLIGQAFHRGAIVGEDERLGIERARVGQGLVRRCARSGSAGMALRLARRFSSEVGWLVAYTIELNEPGTSITCTDGNTSAAVLAIASTI